MPGLRLKFFCRCLLRGSGWLLACCCWGAGAVAEVAGGEPASAQRLAGGALAQKNYRLYCMGCHQAQGQGLPSAGIPNMREEVGRFLRLPEGRAYLAQVPGVLHTPLNDADTAAVLNWVLENVAGASRPKDFVPYEAQDITHYRATVPADIPSVRVRLLERLQESSSELAP